MSQLSELMDRTIVLHRMRLIYVPVQKAGSTSVKRWLYRLEHPGAPVPDDIHGRQSNGFAALSDLSTQKFAEVLVDRSRAYTLFTMVRHPFARFASAYRDKVQGLTGAGFTGALQGRDRRDSDVLAFVAALRGCAIQDVAEISLDEFCSFVEQSRMPLCDRHWRAQQMLLCTGSLRYDHIFRLEDIATDPGRLPEALGQSLPFDEMANQTSSAKSPLPTDIQVRLARIYAADLRQFGYEAG